MRVKGLDGLRGVSVFLVFGEHSILRGHGLGGLGVHIFFVLSGFLIAGILHNQRNKIDNNFSNYISEQKTFLARRARRIFPVYYLVLLYLVFEHLSKNINLNQYGLIWYFLFASNFYIEFYSHSWSHFSHLWSLAVEQQFYLIISPILLSISRQKHFYVLILFLFLMLTGFYYLLGYGGSMITVSPFHGFCFIATGAIISLLRIKPNTSEVIFAVSLLAVVLSRTFFPEMGKNDISPEILSVLHLLGDLLLLGSFILYLTAKQDCYLVYLLENKFIKRLGEISYGFYVYHFIGIRLNLSGFKGLLLELTNSSDIMNFSLFIVRFLFTYFLALMSWELLEKRILHRARRIQN